MDEKPKEPLKVLDRRKFTPDGQRREGVDIPEPEPARLDPPPAAAPDKAPDKAAEDQPKERQPGTPAQPTSTFAVLVQDLAQNCAFSLGLIPDPATGRARVDLQSAGLYIDFLETLQQKTRGNLDLQETQILEDWLFQLKMLYAKASQSRPK